MINQYLLTAIYYSVLVINFCVGLLPSQKLLTRGLNALRMTCLLLQKDFVQPGNLEIVFNNQMCQVIINKL